MKGDSPRRRRAGPLGLGVLALALLASGVSAQTLRVPADHPTIQGAVDAAGPGATVLVAPGTYVENVVIDGKDITLASELLTTGNPALVAQTIVDGGGGDAAIEARLTTDLTILGLTIRNAANGIVAHEAVLELLDCIVTDTGDGIDWEGHGSVFGGAVRRCLFVDNSDDAIDLDDAVFAVIEDNVLRDNGDDGIEIRLHGHVGETLEIVIRRNEIVGNGEDGIQLIGYPQPSDRSFVIERNLILDNAAAGIGLMDDGVTLEDFRGAPLPDPITVVHNVIDGHVWGMTGGANVTFHHNAVLNGTQGALKNLDGTSLVSWSGLWQNGTDFVNCNTGPGLLFADPLLADDYVPTELSPYVDAGDPACLHPNGTVCDIGRYELGAAPDLELLVDVQALPSSGEAPLEVDFRASVAFDPSLEITGWTWDLGDGTSSGHPMPSHRYTTIGTFIVVLTLTDAGGEEARATTVVQTTAPPDNGPPVADVAVTPTVGLLPLTVDFDGSGSTDAEGPLTHHWTFGDGQTGSGATTSHTYLSHGTFIATLRVTDEGGLTDSVSATINAVDPALNDPPQAAFTAWPPVGDAPLLVDLDGSASTDADGTIVDWSWDLGDGSFAAGPQVTGTYRAPGAYPVTLTVTDDVGHEDGTSFVVSVHPAGSTTSLALPVAAGGGDAEESSAGAIVLDDDELELVADGGAPQTVGLRFPALDVPAEASVDLAWLQFQAEGASVDPASLLLRAEAADDAAPYGAARVPLSARPLTRAAAGWIPAPWETGGAAGPAQRTPNLAPVLQEVVDRPSWAAGQAVSLIVTGTGLRRAVAFDGDPGGAPRLHVGYTLPCAGFGAAFDAQGVSGCAPLAVSFRDLSSGEIDAWLWDFGDGTTSSEPEPLHGYAAAGTYTVSLTVTNADCEDTATAVDLVTVVEPPVPGFGVSPASGHAPLTVAFTAHTAGQGITSWSWDFGDGGAASGPDAVHVYEEPGTYTVTLAAENVCGTNPVHQVGVVTVDPPLPPVVAGLVPATGPTLGGSVVTLHGEHLAGGAVTFGGAPAAVLESTPSELVVATPPGPAGPVDVVVTTGGGSATVTDGYTYVELLTHSSPSGPLAHGTTSSRVATSSDDAEERATGLVRLTSSDVELVTDGTLVQTVGLRFTDVDVPRGATITAAAIQFQTDQVDTVPTSLVLHGQAADDPPTFTTTNGDVTSRPLTAASVAWSPPPWEDPGTAGPDQRTPDLSAIVQEIVDRPGWSSGQALVVLVSGSGNRTAEAFDGVAAAAPLLAVEFVLGDA